MVDELNNKQIEIDIEYLKEILGIEIVQCSAREKDGIKELFNSLEKHSVFRYKFNYNDTIEKHISFIIDHVEEPYKNRFVAVKILEKDIDFIETIEKLNNDTILNDDIKKYIMSINSEEIADSIAVSINDRSKDICSLVQIKNNEKTMSKLDKIFSNKRYTIPLMLVMIFAIFLITIVLANYPSELLSKLFIYFWRLVKELNFRMQINSLPFYH